MLKWTNHCQSNGRGASIEYRKAYIVANGNPVKIQDMGNGFVVFGAFADTFRTATVEEAEEIAGIIGNCGYCEKDYLQMIPVEYWPNHLKVCKRLEESELPQLF